MAVEKSTEPIRKTAAYKALSDTLIDALDDSGSAKHAGFEEREARRLRRHKRLEKAGRVAGMGPKRIIADPEFVVHFDVFAMLIIAQGWRGCGSSQRFAKAGSLGKNEGNKSLPPEGR